LPATEVTFIAFSKAVANLLRLFCALDGETTRELTVSKTTRYVSDIHAKAKKSVSELSSLVALPFIVSDVRGKEF